MRIVQIFYHFASMPISSFDQLGSQLISKERVIFLSQAAYGKRLVPSLINSVQEIRCQPQWHIAIYIRSPVLFLDTFNNQLLVF